MSLKGRFKRSAGSTKKQPKQSGTFRSRFEEKIAKSLQALGAPVIYEKSRLKYTIPQSNHTYIPDFDLPNGIFL